MKENHNPVLDSGQWEDQGTGTIQGDTAGMQAGGHRRHLKKVLTWRDGDG